MRRTASYALCIVLAFALAGCTSLKPGLLTGQGILAMGQTFVDTGEAYNQLHDQGIISDEEYREWARFARQFKAAYPPLVNVYKVYAADAIGDPDLEYQVANLLTSINRELLIYMFNTRRR